MVYDFSRQPAEWSDVGLVKQISGSAKYIVSNQGIVCGEFLYNRRSCAIIYGGKQIQFNIQRTWFNDRSAILTDISSNEIIGAYFRSRRWWNRNLWDGVTLHNIDYTFKRLRPDIRYSLFKRNTWNHYKFSLSGAAEEFTYTFKIDYGTIAIGDYFERSRFNGTVLTNTDNLLPLLAGFSLIEENIRNDSL